MSQQNLADIARSLVAPGKGILAADESTGTIKKRFDSIDVESTEETRRAYRELLFTTSGAEDFVSGVILFDETARQKSSDGTPFVELLTAKGVLPGIKVDKGAKPLAGATGEKVTEGLDGLRESLAVYRAMGCRFAKWRAVIDIDEASGLPSDYCLAVNAHALARYAALCVEADIVPIVEPEVLMDGEHSIDVCYQVSERTLFRVFEALREQRVPLEHMLLKPNMVISGAKCPQQASADEVADRTVACFRRTVPAAVPGIVFLSGGQSDVQATANLNAINARYESLPWEVSFSYGRALQAPALATWLGQDANVGSAQDAYFLRAKMNGAARAGGWSASMESS